MKCYAAFDTFAAGNGKNPHPDMPGIKKDGFACEVYGLDADGKPVIRKQSAADHLHTVGSIDDFGEIFLNPGNEEVQAYVLALLKEFVDTYHPDGIVLDRVRYVGLSTDFSEQSRKNGKHIVEYRMKDGRRICIPLYRRKMGIRKNRAGILVLLSPGVCRSYMIL